MNNLCVNCQNADRCLCQATGDATGVVCEKYIPKQTQGVISFDVVTDGLKHDGGKPMLALVPSAIIRAVGRVMTHGAEKYKKDSWRSVNPERYKHALMRHICEWLDDPYGVDKDADCLILNISLVMWLFCLSWISLKKIEKE
jgi:hypothetical protein